MWHVLAGAFDELLVKPFGLVGCAGAGERGSVALLAVGVQGELRNDEHLAVHVGKRAVRLAVLVLEDAQLEDLAPQPLDLVGAVVRAHAQQDQVAAFARANRFAIDIHLRMRHALHQSPHKTILSQVFAHQHNASRMSQPLSTPSPFGSGRSSLGQSARRAFGRCAGGGCSPCSSTGKAPLARRAGCGLSRT